MRYAVAGILVIALAAACSPRETAPGAVQATLAAIETLGLRCGDGLKDNVPSGLFQWSCSGAIEGVHSTLLVDGNQEGVAGLTLLVDDPSDPRVARSQFGRLVDAVPPLTNAPVLKDTLASWTGRQQAWTVGGVRISALCDATHCIVTVLSARDALRPLPLP
jgi:hypothetical protein